MNLRCPDDDWQWAERRAPAILVGVLFGLVSLHIVWAALSGMSLSADEAHYLNGALGIAEPLRAGRFADAWATYRTALGFKAPLICVPAALLMALTGEDVLSAMLSLVLIFVALGGAVYSLFRNCMSRIEAAAGALLLITSPLITGLTHRFYVEGLLLLVTVLFLDVLLRRGLARPSGAILAGILLGLGALAKLSFLPTVFPAAFGLWLLGIRAAVRAGEAGGLSRYLTGTIAMIVVAFTVAWPWYGRNLAATIAHAATFSTSASDTGYSTVGWLLTAVSSGPHLFAVMLAIAGLRFLPDRLRAAAQDGGGRELRAWVVLLLLGATTLALTAAAVTKANRFTVTGLPLVAALAAFFPAAWLGPTRRALAVLAGAVALSVLLSLHNSFSILPVASFRLGDLRLLDDRFPLNVPDWFDDNRPLNRADLRWEGVVQAVAADARSHFLPGTRIRVRLAEHGLLINHDWLNFVARRHGLPLDFSWWYGTELYGPDAPDYILDAQGLDRLAPGRHFFDFVPELRKEIDAGHLPYRLAGRWAGPGGSELTWYRSTLAPVDPSAPLRHVREAEAFERGTAVVDRDQWGLGIGVLITPPGLSNTEVEYHLILPHPGLYRVDLRLASAEPRPLQVEVDGRLISGVVGGDVTGGFLPANQAWVRGFVFFSDSNEVGLRIQRHGPFPHIDRIQVAPID